MADLKKQLAQRLRTERGEQTLRTFAKKAGIDHATLARIEQQRENITLATIQKICDGLDCNVGWLFGGLDQS